MKASVQKALEQIFREEMDVNNIKDLIVHELTKTAISHVNNKVISHIMVTMETIALCIHKIKAVINLVNKVINHANKADINLVNNKVTKQDSKVDTNKDQIMATKVTNNKVIAHTITKAKTKVHINNKVVIKATEDINHAKDTTLVTDNKINVNVLQDTIQMQNIVLKSELSIVKTI